MKKRKFSVTGQVIDLKTKTGIPNLKVEAWDKDLILDDLLGSAVTDEQGVFNIDLKRSCLKEIWFDRKPDLFFKVFLAKQLLKSTEDSILWNVKTELTEIVIEVDISIETVKNQQKVSGKIITSVGAAAGGLKVIAIHKGPRNDVVLGEAITDDLGNYIILFTSEALPNGGKQPADIEIKIVDPDDQSKIYGTSAVHYNASKDEKINLILQEKSIEKTSEFLRVSSELAAHLRGVPFKDLREDKDHQDISLLANKTGWDARMVAMVSMADKYSHETGIPAEFYYALFRAGIPSKADQLYQIKDAALEKIWEKAADENIILPGLKEEISQNITKFKESRKIHLLGNAKSKSVGIFSLKDMLDISLPENSDQQDFVDLYYNHTGDMSSFWTKAEDTFGTETAANLQLDGKLGFLTLNNATLIRKFRTHELVQNDPVDMIRKGYYKTDAWKELLAGDIQLPEDIPGGTDEEKKKENYRDAMVFQLKKSYPTAVIAEMVNNDELPVKSNVKEAVYQFFHDNHGNFEIGVHPVEQFLQSNNINMDPETLAEVKKLQRVFQISPNDATMKVLWDNQIDSAYSVVQFEKQDFINRFAEGLGGEHIAKMTYLKAHQVHSTVLNAATLYLTHRINTKPYAISSGPNGGSSNSQVSRSSGSTGSPAAETLALFESMDFCTCEHCKSLLSPAAYLADILHFIDPENKEDTPLEVLKTRRPDILHIQLTCENTHTVLPYVDLVNEILEYYVVNESIEQFKAPDVENITSAELLANPQFVNDRAYNILKQQFYPFNLPFDYHLEALRLYYHHLKVPLHEAMEKLRVDDRLDTQGNAGDPPYAWRDIYNEYLGISPEEFRVFTDSSELVYLLAYFGEEDSMPIKEFINKFSNAKKFSRTCDITYKELIEITRTQFINPNAHLIPKLEKLEVSFADIKAFRDSNYTDPDFIAQIPTGLDLLKYSGDVVTWLQDNYDRIMHLILLRDFSDEDEGCGFDKVELRYSLPDDENNLLEEIEFWRLLRFIRLWRKLGWTIEEKDKTITALYKHEPGGDSDLEKLDNGFKDLLIKIAHVTKIMEALNLNRKKSLVKLLALWSDIDTHGSESLYKEMFLSPAILKIDEVFNKDEYGEYLKNFDITIGSHKPALQAAFNITGEELSLILEHAGFDEKTNLSLENVSIIYRYGFLARVLKLSIQELITLKAMSGIDPFHELEYEYVDQHGIHKNKQPATLQFIELVQLIKQSGFKITTLGYFLRHEDVTGKASPCRDDILAFAKTIKDGLVRIRQEHKVEDDPTGETAKSKMALVYENDAVDRFFGFLKETSEYSVFSVEYTHPREDLEQSLKINDRISYDHSENRLNYQGIMPIEDKEAFEDAANTLGSLEDFKQAIDELYNAGQDFYNQFPELENFLLKFPDLEGPYEAFLAFTGPGSDRFAEVLKGFLPDLVKKLKHLFVKQTLGASANIDPAVLGVLLENKDVIHSVESNDEPAVEDFLKLEENGVPGSQFYLEVPDNGSYNFYLDADTSANIVFSIDGSEIDGSITGQIWHNDPIELTAGRPYLFEFEITGPANITSLKWQSKGIARESIPVKYMYPYEIVQNFSSTYLRVLKAAALVEGLALTGKETRLIGTALQVNGKGFLNAVPVTANPGNPGVGTLFGILMELFRYARVKESLKIKDESLATLFENPAAVGENGAPLLLKITGWDQSSTDELLTRFNWNLTDLPDLAKFLRMNDAIEIVKKFAAPAPGLLDWTGNRPEPHTVRDIQDTLRAKYDESAWLEVLQPINDGLRDRRRDALVSYVLHQMQQSENENLKKIDTPNKLFEYFLIDVEMEPCMKTSRIKQAISTVQLFIQRCLMNLEPEVSSGPINANQWEWMKRYRVWEANRKVFLYPENWLEPELRDNKSPFFRDLESELLQADITDELAETALLNYLEKLDEIAKLEICGMYLQENEKGNKEDDILHVFGRTTGVSRKYYYRRFEYGCWTPWEKVDLDIEDNPILPVVWKDRLFLFWLNILRKGPDGSPIPTGEDKTEPEDLTLDDLNQAAKETIEINLSWSEYYNNKWQPRRTSDFEKPIKLRGFNVGQFKRENIAVSSTIETGVLKIYIGYMHKGLHYFKLYNKHSVPIKVSDEVGSGAASSSITDSSRTMSRESMVPVYIPTVSWDSPLGLGFTGLSAPDKDRTFLTGDNKLNIDYKSFQHKVLKGPHSYAIVKPNHFVGNIYEAPFFCQDRKHVFFVKPEESWEMIPEYDRLVLEERFGLAVDPDPPPVWDKPDDDAPEIGVDPPEIETNVTLDIRVDPGLIDRGLIDPGSIRPPFDFMDPDNYIDRVINSNQYFNFDDVAIGPMGSIHAKLQYNNSIKDYENVITGGFENVLS